MMNTTPVAVKVFEPSEYAPMVGYERNEKQPGKGQYVCACWACGKGAKGRGFARQQAAGIKAGIRVVSREDDTSNIANRCPDCVNKFGPF
jgi:hypothetical protein